MGENLELKKDLRLEIDRKGKILKIESKDCKYPKEDIESLSKNSLSLMMPGLIDSHVHIADNFAKEKGFNRNLIEVVAPPDGIKHRLLRSTLDPLKREGIKLALKEMRSNGIIFFADFREEGQKGIHLLKKIIKNEVPKGLLFGRFETAPEIESVFKIADGIGLSSYKHLTNSLKEQLIQNKNHYKKLIACHVAEVKRDENLMNRIFEENLIDIIVHGTHLNTFDLQRIKEQKIALILCPRCNGYFGVGFPPIQEILQENIPISLGTDNLMANSPDLFEEMRYLYYISRTLNKNPKEIQITAIDLLKMVTVNAAKNLRLDKEMGSISKNKFANLIMLDLSDDNYFIHSPDLDDIYPLIIQRTKPGNIKKVYYKGVSIYERS